MSKLDYCNVALAGLPSCHLDRLQSVINAAARLTADHITALLADLHWLRIPQRIQYKLCVPVRSGVGTELAAERHLPGRECGITVSSGDLIVPATRRTTMGAGPRLRRRSTARLEQSARRDPPQPISVCLQAFTQNSLLYAEFLLIIVFITFNPRAVNIVKCP